MNAWLLVAIYSIEMLLIHTRRGEITSFVMVESGERTSGERRLFLAMEERKEEKIFIVVDTQ